MFIPRAAALLSSGVLIPLYINPIGGPDCAPWARLLQSADAHPNLPFYAIINPFNGPNGTPGSQPGAEYQQCIPVLKKPNVRVLGYVATTQGVASEQARVLSDIDTYNGWSAAWRPDGIFFDEVSGASGQFAQYSTYSSRARGEFSFVALNPGATPSDSRYFTLGDLLLTGENFFDRFSSSTLRFGPDTPASKQAVVLTDGPASVPTALINELVGQDHIGAIWVTDDSQANGANPYDSLPANTEAFVAAVQAASS